MQYIYLIHIKDGRYNYKIGIANDVQSRLAQLQTGSPYELEVIESYGFDNAEVVERAIHQAFKKSHIRGEWFELNMMQVEEDFSKICTMLGGQYNPVDETTTEREVEEAESIDFTLEDVRTELRMQNGEPRGVVLVERNSGRKVVAFIGKQHEEFEKYLEKYKQEHPNSKFFSGAN